MAAAPRRSLIDSEADHLRELRPNARGHVRIRQAAGKRASPWGSEGNAAFITGAARGQGRSHAVRLASEGADIIALDICADIESMDYSNAAPAELAETVELVEAQGQRIVATVAKVRDLNAVCSAFQAGFDEFGRIDTVIANAGILKLSAEVDPIAEWRDIIDVNVTGAFHTVRAAIPSLLEGGRGGSTVITSSTAGLKSQEDGPSRRCSGVLRIDAGSGRPHVSFSPSISHPT